MITEIILKRKKVLWFHALYLFRMCCTHCVVLSLTNNQAQPYSRQFKLVKYLENLKMIFVKLVRVYLKFIGPCILIVE